MAYMDLCGTIMRTSEIINDLRAIGLRIVLGNDFTEYAQIRERILGREKIYPMFDVDASFVDETNGFWLCGFNDENEVVHTQAARLLHLDGITLGRHLDVHKQKYITPDTTPDPSRTKYKGPKGLSIVTGRVCYHGDFWMSPRGLASHGGLGATQILSQLVFELDVKQWNVDFAFAIIPKRMAVKGLQTRYGFTNCEPGRWIGPDGQVTEEDYLAWITGTDIKDNLSSSQLKVQRTAKTKKLSTGVVVTSDR